VLSAGLGHSAFRTRQAAVRFRKANLGLIMQLYPYYKDRDTFVSMSRRGREQLQEQIAREREAGDGEEPRDWD
jgi:glutathione-regulated potassium-efflux system ancillary protein KefC